MKDKHLNKAVEKESCCSNKTADSSECHCHDNGLHSADNTQRCTHKHPEPIKLGEFEKPCCASGEGGHNPAPSLKLKKFEKPCCAAGHDETEHGAGCACCDMTPDYSEKPQKRGLEKETVRQIVLLCVSLAFLVAGYFDWHHISGGKGFLMAFYYVNPAWVAVLLCGVRLYKGAFRALKNRKMNAAVLISIAMTAAIVLEIAGFFVNTSADGHSHSYVFAAGEIAFLMALGEMLEDITVRKCRSGIQRLVSLIPKEANVKTDEGIVTKTLNMVNIGDVVVVKAGEMVAVDGVVIKGDASIDQSSLTGEYLPVDVTVGSVVFGGTMNKNGVIEVEVTKLQKDMTIAKMAELTIEAEGKKAPISRVADKWVGRIVPIVLATSLIVGLVVGFGFGLGAMTSIIRAITVLVVFCPCALALATPTAVAAGLGNSARNGVLVKSGASLEELARVDTICFDKTGTVTEGKIELDGIVAVGMEEEELLTLAASVEQYSEHPLALAVMNRADKNSLCDAENIRTLQGVGILAEIGGQEVLVMSFKKAVENGVNIQAVKTDVDKAMAVGKTVVIVTVDGILAGMLAFSDTIRENAAAVMASLAARGYNTVMLTGDNEKSANYIAEQCNIKSVKHSLMPEDKLREIEALQKAGHKVAMVGDGINDAPSLKLADCSFAMSAMGSDIAIDTADMAILNSDIQKVDDTLKLSKRVMFGIKRNIVIAMSVNVVAVVCSMMGWLTPVTGALVHNCTSVLVVLSSALLLYNRKRKKQAIEGGVK